MTTLESIGFAVVFGATVFTASSIAFGCAIRKHSVFVSPRCIARPKQVIYNPHAVPGSAQDRSSYYCFPSIGWIPWVLSIPYDTMLKGVPGTGTREGGMSGCMLKLGLDAVVLLRFHVVGLKLSALATVLLLLIMLPIYKTSVCFGDITDPSLDIMTIDGVIHTRSSTTGETVTQAPSCNLTNYERLTLANIPSLSQVSSYGESFVHPQESGILSKLYACCFIFLILMTYLLYLLQQEWVQILAMRRVYYFERDIYGQRKQELADMTTRSLTRNSKNKSMEQEKHLIERDPWVPHPEQRDTVPSIALYSVLVGGIPQPPPRPRQSSSTLATHSSRITGNSGGGGGGDDDDDDAVYHLSKRESIDWQLSLCGAFFDHCVPNQPGFSSSVAAVSILPGVRDISIGECGFGGYVCIFLDKTRCRAMENIDFLVVVVVADSYTNISFFLLVCFSFDSMEKMVQRSCQVKTLAFYSKADYGAKWW
jgi:Late exocytosis, associated with Golgi transport